MIVISVVDDNEVLNRIKDKLGVDVMSISNVSMVPDVIKTFTRPVWVVDVGRDNALTAIEKASNAVIIAVTYEQMTADKAVFLIGKAVELLPVNPSVDRIVEAVTRHTTQFSAHGYTIDTYLRKAWYQGQEFELYSTRFDIFSHLIQMAGRQTSYRDIALAVYNERLSEQDALKRLKSHIHYLRKDLKKVSGEDILKSQNGSVFWLSK